MGGTDTRDRSNWVLAGLLAACAPAGGSSGTETSTSTTSATRGASVTDATTSAATSAAASSTSASETATSAADTSDADGSSSSSSETGTDDCLGFDANGVAQLYCTDPAGAPPWVLGFDAWEDRVTRFGEVSGKGAQTIVLASDQVRMTVAAEDPECEGLEDHGLALAQGWMCSPLDWSDYEITGYVQLVTASSEQSNQDFTWYGGGGRHTGDGPPEGCWGSSYKGSYDYVAGDVRFGKESWHVNYDYRDGWIDVGGPDLSAEPERWIGMKVVRYRFERAGEAGIRNELWLDLGGVDEDGAPANAWELATVSEDHPDQPSWGTEATACGAPQDDQIMFWGGPWVTWRWDDTTARLRLMSVREILPPRMP